MGVTISDVKGNRSVQKHKSEEMSSRYPGKGKDWRKGIPTQATYTIHSRMCVHTWMHAATHTSHTPTNPHILHKASTSQHGAGFITFSNADKILMKQWLKETINYFLCQLQVQYCILNPKCIKVCSWALFCMIIYIPICNSVYSTPFWIVTY